MQKFNSVLFRKHFESFNTNIELELIFSRVVSSFKTKGFILYCRTAGTWSNRLSPIAQILRVLESNNMITCTYDNDATINKSIMIKIVPSGAFLSPAVSFPDSMQNITRVQVVNGLHVLMGGDKTLCTLDCDILVRCITLAYRCGYAVRIVEKEGYRYVITSYGKAIYEKYYNEYQKMN